MNIDEVKNGCLVIDRWYTHYGTGRIENVKKTVFTVIFGDKEIQYDFAHARFLEVVENKFGK